MDMFIKFLVAAVLAGTPLLYGTLGEIISEKTGHLNLGVEGMMSIGACAGFMAGYYTDNFFFALAASFVAGLLSAMIYAVLTITFMANQNVTGLTLTIFRKTSRRRCATSIFRDSATSRWWESFCFPTTCSCIWAWRLH